MGRIRTWFKLALDGLFFSTRNRTWLESVSCKAPSLGHIERSTGDAPSVSRELAPLAGHYPCLRLGPSWWFHDSYQGMMRFREQVTETAGFYNTVGFNDDTRAFLSIPARHDVARRLDCSFLAKLVTEHRVDEDETYEIAEGLSYKMVKRAYRL